MPANLKENKPKKKADKKFIITLTCLSCLFLFIGSGAGYYFYDVFNKPEEGAISGGDVNSLGDIAKRNLAIEKALKEDNVETAILPYDIVNYSYDLFSSYSYNLIIGSGSALANAGITKVEQVIKSATFNTPDVFFTQKESDSSFVHAADRYYEDRENKIINGYETKRASDWGKTQAKKYTYDDYIQTYGKLPTGNYYCYPTSATKDKPIPEKFLTYSYDEFESSDVEGKFLRSGALIYNLSKSTVKPVGSDSKTQVKKTNNGYQVVVDLDVISQPYSVAYYAVQMKSTGDLARRPIFSECVLTINLDSELNLISSEFFDHYSADTGMIAADTTSVITQYYFYGDSNSFNGVEVTIPTVDDSGFSGFELFPNNDKGGEL